MDELRKQVGRAYRRLGVRRFFGALGWCWFAALLIALVVIAVDKFYPVPWSPFGWGAWGWLGGMAVAGLAVAVLWVFFTRRGPLEAAIEIDQRFGLKERVSSTLAMPEEDLQTEAGRALLKDAVRRVERVDVASRFSVVPPRRMLLPLVPAVLAVLVAVLVADAVVENPAEAKPEDPEIKKQIKRTTDAVRRKLAERREQAKKMGLKDAEDLFKKLEQGDKDDFTEPNTRKQALAKLSDLAEQLKQRRQKIGGADKIKKQLEQLQKNLDRGPADKFSKSLSKGDFKQAAQELQKLKDQINNSKLNPEQKEQLADQLEQMKQKVEQLADAQKQAQQDLQQRVDQLRQAGQDAEADKLEQQLEKLLQQAPQMQQMQNLAEKMGECAKCMRNGQMGEAGKAMDQLQAGLNDLQQQLDEMGMLDDAMKQIAQAKDQINCQACGGAGCDQCKGPQAGMGAGQGKGERPEADSETAFYDTQVKQKVKRGAADIVDLVDGPNTKGQVQAEIQEQFEATQKGSTDPLTTRRIPRKQRKHVREYFDQYLPPDHQ